jgi:hypothetical protein
MSLLPREASYSEEVSDYFLAHARGGLMLSSLDAEMLIEWQALGIPAAVVCRGIKAAAEARRHNARPGDDKLRSLRACERAVAAEWKKHRELSAGRGGG